MSTLCMSPRSGPPSLATASFFGIIAGMLPSRDAGSIEVAVKADETGRIYDCMVPLALVANSPLSIGDAVEIIGVEAAPRFVRAVGLAIFA